MQKAVEHPEISGLLWVCCKHGSMQAMLPAPRNTGSSLLCVMKRGWALQTGNAAALLLLR